MESLARSGRCCAWEQVLILGWGDSAFMSMLLRELDRGPAALPRGSELTLFNSREGLLGSIRDRAQLEALSVLHVQGNPLDQDDLTAKLDISKCAAPKGTASSLGPSLDCCTGPIVPPDISFCGLWPQRCWLLHQTFLTLHCTPAQAATCSATRVWQESIRG